MAECASRGTRITTQVSYDYFFPGRLCHVFSAWHGINLVVYLTFEQYDVCWAEHDAFTATTDSVNGPKPGHDNACGLPTPGSCAPTDEICDGRDNDCDGTIDEMPSVGYSYGYNDYLLMDEISLGCFETPVPFDFPIACPGTTVMGRLTLACGRDWNADENLRATYSQVDCDGEVLSGDVEASQGCAVLDSSTAPGVDFFGFQSFQCCDLSPRSCSIDNGRCGDARVFECVPYEAGEVFCQLRDVNMFGRNLVGAQLNSTDLASMILENADLTGAHLYNANLIYANLYNANLTGADLWRAQLSGANLRSASLASVYTLFEATYNVDTLFPAGFDPQAYGMILVP